MVSMIEVPASDAHDLDEVVRELGIEDSDTTPAEAVRELNADIERLNAWVADLQSGMYVNCVYCGHRYGPGETTPVSIADALKAHIARCPQHPMSKLRLALLSSPCPLPICGARCVKDCIEDGHCGCDNIIALEMAPTSEVKS